MVAIRNIPRDRFGKFVGGKNNDGRKDPRKERVKFVCPTCGKVKKYLPSQLRYGKRIRQYCSKKCIKQPKGKAHHSWKGGKTTIGGYTYLKEGGWYKAKHRIVIEKHLGRRLKGNEIVHHKNGIKTDNRLKNLEVVLRTTHHGKVVCPYCEKGFKIR